MKLISIISISLIAFQTQAQSVIATSGEVYSNSSIELSFTIGEAIITSYNHQMNSGFHQIFTSNDPLSIEVDQENVQVYPNPFSKELWIKSSTSSELSYQFYSMSGVRVAEGIIRPKGETSILPELRDGIFLLKLIDPSKEILKSIQVIKRNQSN